MQRWLVHNLPEPLLSQGPLGLDYWQFIALPLGLSLAWFMGLLLGRLSRALLLRLVRRTSVVWDDKLLERLAQPISWFWSLLILALLRPLLSLPSEAHQVLTHGVRTAVLFCVFWSLLRVVDVFTDVWAETLWAKSLPSSRALLPLLARASKIVVVAMALVAVLSEFGYPVTSLIAGLGIGGLALALAAQKTMENLFGAFSLGIDRPFQEGDLVKIGPVFGLVETIGLRSTKVRTLDRTLVSLPNGKLAETQIESYAARDRLRLVCSVDVVRSTSVAQMRHLLLEIEKLLQAHPKLAQDPFSVRLADLGPSAFRIEIMVWFLTTDWDEYTAIRQELFLNFLQLVEDVGSKLAYSTQTVQISN